MSIKLALGVLLVAVVQGDNARILPIPIDPPVPPIEYSPQPCGPNEYFNSCGGCEATCDHPGPIMCALICRTPGQCRCISGYVRSPDGDCVQAEECPNNSTETPNTSTPYPECGENQYLNDCGGCDGTCQEPNIACPAVCGPPKCRCLPGYVRFGYAGKCILQSQCPRRNDPCATVRCGFGKVCKVRAGRPVCVYPNTKPNPCAYTLCPVNSTCQVVTIYCLVAPCPPPRATCVPVTTTTTVPMEG